MSSSCARSWPRNPRWPGLDWRPAAPDCVRRCTWSPTGPATTRTALRSSGWLIAAGADPNATIGDPPSETPLHWAASTDDVEVAEALIDGEAELENIRFRDVRLTVCDVSFM
jgi:hypothetical protein